MPYTPGRFWAVVGTGWVLLGVAAFWYAGLKSIPAMVALPAAAAFLIEFPFYLLPGFDPGKLRHPALLAASSVLPWLVYSVSSGQFRVAGLMALLAIALALSYWYKLLPVSPLTDLLFLALAASLYAGKVFDSIYLSPIPQFSALGHAMLIRTCAIAVLAIRGGITAEYRFLPTRQETVIGLRWCAAMLPVMALALWCAGLWRLRDHPNIPVGILSFFGILWVVALSEEFFFRGLLQQWLETWTGNQVFALLCASFVFGLAHIGFAHVFPNWRFVLIAGLFGLFCGLCWRQTRSVQASMVTHAIGATLYRVFFQS